MKVKVKICGLKHVEDVLYLNSFPVDYVGFIMYPPSPRYVGTLLSELISLVKTARKVAVFVNPSFEEVRKVLDLGIDLIQLHGEETPHFGKKIGFKRIIKAFRVKDETVLDNLKDWKECYALLLDTYIEGIPGGTGKTFNWEIAKRVTERNYRIFLAGGLSPENVKKAIKEVSPYGIDLSSGIELYPGKKDFKKIEALFWELSKI